EGYVDGSVGSGAYVSRVLPDDLLKAARHVPAQTPAHRAPKRRVAAYAARLPAAMTLDLRRPRAFRTDLPAMDLFPTTLWTQIAARRDRGVPHGLARREVRCRSDRGDLRSAGRARSRRAAAARSRRPRLHGGSRLSVRGGRVRER